MHKEKTIILCPLNKKKVFEVKEEIIREAIERGIHDSTIITANLVRNTISVTSKDSEFIERLCADKDFTVVPIFVPFLN